MPPGTVHPSAFMCPEERSDVLAEVEEKLSHEKSVRVVSTQLVEAGVDIDFPVVYRALARLDSVAQAAGRCNREGKLNAQGKLGYVVVFNPPRSAPPGLLRKGEDACRSVLRENPTLEPDSQLFQEYFRRFFAAVNDFDRARFTERMLDEVVGAKFQFRTFARHFNMIDDEAQETIFVQYHGKKAQSESLIDRLRRGNIDRSLLRQLQRFSVSLPRRVVAGLLERGMICEVEGFLIQENPSLYKPGIGLDVDTELAPESLIL